MLKKLKSQFDGKQPLDIHRRLLISHLLMMVVPILISILVGTISSQLMSSIAMNNIMPSSREEFLDFSESVAASLEKVADNFNEQSALHQLKQMKYLLDQKNFRLIVRFDDWAEPISYGNPALEDKILMTAVNITQSDYCFLFTSHRQLYAKRITIGEMGGTIYIFGYVPDVNASDIRKLAMINLNLVILITSISIFFVYRFIVNFLSRRINSSIDTLIVGVSQIRDGNLDYRIPEEKLHQDEFSPGFECFNEMASHLQALLTAERTYTQQQKEILTGISHDLRSPLTSIRAYVEGLLDGIAKTPEAQRSYLMTIKNKTEAISQMVDKLFLFSKMDMGEYPVNLEKLVLGDEIREYLKAMREEYLSKGLVPELEEQECCTVVADPEQLRRICSNILENSAKYKEKELGRCKIIIFKEGNHAVIRFDDDGPGVPEEALPRLFDIFYRSDASRRNPQNGSGIGLSIVTKAIAQMNGSVKAENIPGGGLRIQVTLPLAENGTTEEVSK